MCTWSRAPCGAAYHSANVPRSGRGGAISVLTASYDGPDTLEAQNERARVAAGELPPRYAEPWARPFFAATQPALTPGAAILDVGSGRRPALPPEERPAGCTYVGLDVSGAELAAAGEDAYDETVVNDISRRQDDLKERFDLVLSWQVLEHVPSLEDALENMHGYLRPGGRMVAHLSGSLAAFSLLGRVLPHPVSSRLMQRLLGAAPEEKFPTRYDRCRATKLRPLLARWSEHGIVPRYKGGGYFRFSRPLERTYLAYENWAERSGRPDLATHYVIWAVK
jgi:SAM-dependent methyltransferase